jgi:cardiolipin synthase
VLEDLWTVVAASFTLAVALAASGHAVLHKRDVRAALGWIAFIWLAPIVGGAAYAVFGVNRIRRRAHALGLLELPRASSAGGRRPVPAARARGGAPRGPAHARGHGRPPPTRRGQPVELLPGGAVAYPAMIAAIDAAQRSVTFCTYIFDPGVAGEAFADALARAASGRHRARAGGRCRRALPLAAGAPQAPKPRIRTELFLPRLTPGGCRS